MSTTLIIILCLLGVGSAYLVWATAIFTKVVPRVLPFEEVNIAYVTFTGDYSEAYKQSAVVEGIVQKELGIDLTQQPCFGIYYDNPQVVERSKCRSIVGKILPKDFKIPESTPGITYDKILRIPESLQIMYPIRSILSFIVGMTRCYKAMDEFIKQPQYVKYSQSKSPILEIYGWQGKNVCYLAPFSETEGLMKDYPKPKGQ